jgi:O-acetyl-ADP-ribose deacetylase (regulator of RNase III)
LRDGSLRDGLPTGAAVATTAGLLHSRWVVHTVGPVWARRDDRSGLLASAFTSSLDTARNLGARSVAFPAVSAGVYGWPADDAARIAVAATRGWVSDHPDALDAIRFVLFSSAMLTRFERALAA